MKCIRSIRLPFYVLSFFAALIIISCSKEENEPADTGAIKIISLTATDTVLKAWMDTASITVVATGDRLEYEWSCNHGTLHGRGTTVKYMAGECCIGLNTITCRVYNDTSSISKDINIRITSYFDK